MAIRIVRHPSRGHLAPRKVNVVTGKLAAFRDWDDWKYTIGKLPPRYPMPVTMGTAVLSVLHQPNLAARWHVQWMKRKLRGETIL